MSCNDSHISDTSSTSSGLCCVIPASDGDTPPWFCRGKDCPRFKVEKKTEDYELRKYEESEWHAIVKHGKRWLSSLEACDNAASSLITAAKRHAVLHMPIAVKQLLCLQRVRRSACTYAEVPVEIVK